MLLTATLAGQLWAAGVYKWVDDQGKVHFGDRPPATGAEEVHVPQSAPRAPVPDEARRRKDRQRLLDIYDEDRAKEKALVRQRKRDKQALTKDCRRARSQLSFYERTNSLYETGPDGERKYLSEAEREKAIADLRRLIAQHCKGIK